MNRKTPQSPPPPPEDGDYRFEIGKAVRVVECDPMPPGGSRVKYVRGQGIVFMEKIPVPDEQAKPAESVKA